MFRESSAVLMTWGFIWVGGGRLVKVAVVEQSGKILPKHYYLSLSGNSAVWMLLMQWRYVLLLSGACIGLKKNRGPS